MSKATQWSNFKIANSLSNNNESDSNPITSYQIPKLLIHQILLAQRGTVEDVLQILMQEDIDVIAVKQFERNRFIKRIVLLRGHSSGRNFVLAKSTVDTRVLPQLFCDSLRAGRKGIGRLICEMKLETYFEIKRRSHLKDGLPYRRYIIYYKGVVAIRIIERILI